MSYKERNSGFRCGMEQNTSSSEYQRSLPILKVAQMLEHRLNNLADLDNEGPSEGISLVCNLFCPISPGTRHWPLKYGERGKNC